ncbi:MAG TPA: DUF2157 domain-containing protein [Burkholderiales bacterium]|nr:DUF2157 domain-containing protein [Burkholderiales bacterium]
MSTRRQLLIDWMEQGLIAPEKLHAALAVAGVFPSDAGWRRFLDRLLLWLGALMIAAGAIFFFAYNWDDLGRFAKFALAQALVMAALAAIWRTGIEHVAGKVALLAAALFVGALLALVGQTYQTGADTWELFAVWAALILPWAVLGRLAALWLLWLGIVNLAIVFYFSTFGILFGLVFGTERLLWLLFGVNTAALAVWELLALRFAQERWPMRVLAVVSGGLVTVLAIFSILEWQSRSNLGLIAWFGYFAAVYAVYRRYLRDIFMLAGGVLSTIVVIATWFGDLMFDTVQAEPVFLLLALIIIGLSAAGGAWLRRVAAESEA